MNKPFDFSGWATKNDLLCSDGRTIRRNAFKGNDGQVVPLVWMHSHDKPDNVLGHALLENCKDGVYAYCTLNDTYNGRNAKLLIENGDVCALSIYANQLKQNGGDVIHGNIREVSLVLSGANPGAMIDYPIIEHSDSYNYREAVIYTDEGDGLAIYHSDEEDDEEEYYDDDEYEEDDSEYDEDEDDSDYDEDDSDYDEDDSDYDDEDDSDYDDEDDDEEEELSHSEDKTIKEIFDEMTEEQKNVVYYLIGVIVEGMDGKDKLRFGKHRNQK